MKLIVVPITKYERSFLYRCPTCGREIQFCPKCGKPAQLKTVDDVKREKVSTCPCPMRNLKCSYPEGSRLASCPEQKPVLVEVHHSVPACVHCGHIHYHCIGCGGTLTGMGYAWSL